MHEIYIIILILNACFTLYSLQILCMQYALFYCMCAMCMANLILYACNVIILMINAFSMHYYLILYACNTHTQTANMYVFLSQMILFSSCCICGLISGILNFQFVRALAKRPDMRSLHLAIMSLACLGISSCTLSTWLTCRLASSEQQRMFLEREHSLHHSHEMAEKVWELVCLCGLCVHLIHCSQHYIKGVLWCFFKDHYLV